MSELDIPVGELERLKIDPTAEEQRLPVDTELYTEEVLKRLHEHYDIFVERTFNKPIHEDDDQEDWLRFQNWQEPRLKDLQKIRYLCRKQPHCIRALALYLFFVFGSEFTIELTPIHDDDEDVSEAQKKKDRKITNKSRRLWEKAVEENWGSWNFFEFGERYWRDGEQFTRFQEVSWPPQIRFIDPESIGEPSAEIDGSQGIITEPGDATVPLAYQLIDPESKELLALIPAEEVIHTKCDVDSNEKRGISRFFSIIKTSRLYEAFVENEVTHRQAQASIVLVRKVAGRRGPQRMYDNSQTSTTNYHDGVMSREKWRPGTILTTSPDVELDFAQPKSDFTDATPLAKTLLLQLCAATGWSYSMLTLDAGGGSYGAEISAETPVFQMVKHEQAVLSRPLREIFKRIMVIAIESGEFPEVQQDTVFDEFEVNIKFHAAETNDPLKHMQRENLGVISKIQSRAQARRNLGYDNERMNREIEEESIRELDNMAGALGKSGVNPDAANMRQSSQQNGDAGGSNQGDGEPVQHRDKLPGSTK